MIFSEGLVTTEVTDSSTLEFNEPKEIGKLSQLKETECVCENLNLHAHALLQQTRLWLSSTHKAQ
jgi:hypothetical protein